MVGYAFHYNNSRKMMEERRRIKPEWLELLLNKRFFGICEEHKEIRKSEINIYCIECDLCMCSHCIAEDLSHRCHRRLQIRRYVYNDVVRIDEMQKLIDCSKVQTYSLNQAKVIYLNAKAKQSKPSKPPPGSAMCRLCRRSIAVPNRYCSIACKVSYASVEISTPQNKSEPFIPIMNPDLEELSPKEDSSSSSQPSDSAEENPGRWMGDEAAVTAKRKFSRRKGIPRRSPIF